MEMPKDCIVCYDTTKCFGTGRCFEDGTIWCGLAKGYIGLRDTSEKCPLVELPEKHGRLIDADEFDADYEALYKLNDITNGEWFLFREWLKNQKTIVEAEGDD
jgi:hypothetical protein